MSASPAHPVPMPLRPVRAAPVGGVGPARGGRARRVLATGLAVATVFGSGVAVGARAVPDQGMVQAAAGADDAPAGFDVYWQALEEVRDRFVDDSKLTDDNLTWGSIRGMVDALGDSGHTVFLTPDQVRAEQDALDGRVIGVGIEVDLRGDIPLIVSVFDGTPADRAGLRAGDLILAVDGQRTDRLTMDELVRRIRGPRGSRVRLRVQHRDGRIQQVTMVREDVVVPAVSWTFVPGTRIADVRLMQFSEGAGAAVQDAVRRAMAQDASGFILDLRGNPGGLVIEAIRVTSTFMADGVVFQERYRDGDLIPIRVEGGAVAAAVPLAVLVDFGSASASEIVSGAFQDSGRASVIGQRTFGTGTVLEQVDLQDGSRIRLGVAEWLTPNGDRIYDTGITPDFQVQLPVDGVALEPTELEDLTARQLSRSTDTQLRRALQVLRQAP